ncbi:unnamed protein product [Ectocarpus sp. CCAP 1310/34]|nr:unnamed protein product [Ectocarpus sp. CCAP 1310/34]
MRSCSSPLTPALSTGFGRSTSVTRSNKAIICTAEIYRQKNRFSVMWGRASTPGQHSVPFTAKAPSSTAAPATTPPTAATTVIAVTHPPVTAPRSVILDHLMEHGTCYAHVFSACRRQGRCRWRHDLLPASFYKDVPRPASHGATHTRRVVAALTPAHYDTAVAMGLELHVSGEHQVAMMAGNIPLGPRSDAEM